MSKPVSKAGKAVLTLCGSKTPTPPVFRQFLAGQPLEEVVPDSVATENGALEIYFSTNKVNPANNVPIRVVFDGSVVIFNTIFAGRVWDSQSEELGQPVLAGDANPEVGTNTLQVALTKATVGNILRKVEIQSSIFTPNGDGSNDQLRLEYTITQLSEARKVEVFVYDLGGRLVRRLVDERLIGGIYTALWDGADEEGNLVAPGNYLVFLNVSSGIGSFEKTKVVGVAY